MLLLCTALPPVPRTIKIRLLSIRGAELVGHHYYYNEFTCYQSIPGPSASHCLLTLSVIAQIKMNLYLSQIQFYGFFRLLAKLVLNWKQFYESQRSHNNKIYTRRKRVFLKSLADKRIPQILSPPNPDLVVK